ncbi:MAG: DEAD/DEAH box helicase [Caldilineaceae bacterium SB0661_bin_34]|nr:DEAD/DEAH box helicase [Caldilineaceae bacterium SB0661_bin_34]
MSQVSRRKHKQREQSNQHDSQAAPPLLDKIPAKVEVDKSVWTGPAGDLGSYIQDRTRRTLDAYHKQPDLVEEHANLEHDTARGGYAHRQLFELIQNSADALADSIGGRINLKLTDTHLYCADDGQAMSQDGVRALMFSHLSPKRGTAEIGRFGMGFKAVLGVTDSPEFFSHSGSFRFDRTEASNLIRSFVPNAERCPVLRLPYPMDPWPEMEWDPNLHEFMGWATNIVRLPLNPGAHNDLETQFKAFRAEFLLFVNHVSMLFLQQSDTDERLIRVRSEDGIHTLFDRDETSQWMLYSTVHKLSEQARNDSRSLDDATEVPIVWAAPLEQLHQPGEFWAFFPTLTNSLLAGILNAPWKTNEDRQNLLTGEYNEELIGAAAELIAASITDLPSREDPSRHLDALPRRQEAWDNKHSILLRYQLNVALRSRPIVPDQQCKLRRLYELNYQPEFLTLERPHASEALEIWGTFDQRPTHWLHHSALTRIRLARLTAIERLDEHGKSKPMPRAEVSKWLEQLVQAAQGQSQKIKASKTAIRAASKVQDYQAANGRQPIERLGSIVLTAAGSWAEPNPERLFLSGDKDNRAPNSVHPEVEKCSSTRAALECLGIKPRSKSLTFKTIVATVLDSFERFKRQLNLERWQQDADWEKHVSTVGAKCSTLWFTSRLLAPKEAADIIRNDRANWRDALPVRVKSGFWCPLPNVLLPGEIVPSNSSRDADVAVDTDYHSNDVELLKILGVVSAPVAEQELSAHHFDQYLASCRSEFQTFAQSKVGRKPRWDRLQFSATVCSGPLDPMASLSEESRIRYTWRLLDFDATYTEWAMSHETQDQYGNVSFPSPAIDILREYGLVRTAKEVAKLSDGVGKSPANMEVVETLLSHRKASQIRQAFDLQVDLSAEIEPIGEEAGVPIVDVWPALKNYLTLEEMTLQLVRCEGFRHRYGTMAQVELACIRIDKSLYVTQQAEETEELAAVLNELGKSFTKSLLSDIVNGSDPLEVQEEIEAIRQCGTDEERLLAAVGIEGLKRHLPASLPRMLAGQLGNTAGIELARAAMAKFHTGALEAYKDDFQRLHPPRMWAGSERAVRFVQSLGFDEEWAGHRNTKRDPFLEVTGPRTLPPLHEYQRTAVQRVRNLVASNGAGPHRGMLSMPTGSGKTRVAVQAIVESMRDGELHGGILWVADRDELCEQAVEAWQAVWASEGEQASTLRISRLWHGNKRPLPTGKRHVIVASIQTLHSRFSRRSEEYRFLSDFNLVVVDEAHRSIAPSYTSLLQELGLTRWFGDHEPILIGLTATPYRGINEEETRRLRIRYGRRRLDHGVFPTDDPNEVIQFLQSDRILAMADHATIAGGEFELSDDERALAEQNPWLPDSVQERIARDEVRTRRIVNEYLHKVNPNWPTLIFATSVEHSEIVAALLNAEGIVARAVSGKTETSIRRQVVQEFRSGEIKVLVNYGVFREGFDAPKTRAIVVARPVYSPNLYFQMIGRGLRGVRNGGNERCLVLNVKDNIRNFGQDLAFTELDWLWAD